MNTNVVFYCLCGCGKLVFAACLPDAEDSPGTVERIAFWENKGAVKDFVTSDFVRDNWNEHLGELPMAPLKPPAPKQLNLFEQ